MRSRFRKPHKPGDERRGVAIVLILALMSITLGLSYAMLRSQVTEAIVQGNLERTDDARQAALTGASIALQNLHSPNWTGVDTSFAGQLSANESYTVRYSVGDAELQEGQPDYQEFPYRVTATVVGTAAQAGNDGTLSRHTIRFVAQLARSHLQPTPDAWQPTKTNALYQANRRTGPTFHLPLDINGPVQIRADGRLGEDYPPDQPLQRYLADLARMHQDGAGDYRPFDTTVRTRRAAPSFDYLVSQLLQIPLEVVTFPDTNSVSSPDSTITHYQLYPGGPSYTIPIHSSTSLENFSSQPGVLDNPLGVICLSEACTLSQNVTIQGTILSKRTIRIAGSDVALSSPTLTGNETRKLPALVVGRDLLFEENSAGSIQGAIACFQKTDFSSRTTTARVSLLGPLWTRKFFHRGRQQWNDISDEQWTAWLGEFENQLEDKDITPIRYFPAWLEEKQGLRMQATVRLDRGPSEVIHHWTDWSKPLYQTDPGTGGLHWNMIRWRDLGPN